MMGNTSCSIVSPSSMSYPSSGRNVPWTRMLGGAPAERWRSEPPASSRWPSSSSMCVGAGLTACARGRHGRSRRECAPIGEHRDDVLRRRHCDLGDDRSRGCTREGEHDARVVHREGQHTEAPRVDREHGGERLRRRTELGRFDPADAIRRRHVRPPRALCCLVRPCRGRPGAAAPCPAPARPGGCRPSWRG